MSLVYCCRPRPATAGPRGSRPGRGHRCRRQEGVPHGVSASRITPPALPLPSRLSSRLRVSPLPAKSKPTSPPRTRFFRTKPTSHPPHALLDHPHPPATANPQIKPTAAPPLHFRQIKANPAPPPCSAPPSNLQIKAKPG